MALTKVTAAVLEPTAVTDNISNGSIDSAKIADDAIVTDKIADGAVATAKIVDDAVTSAKIVDSGVTSAKIAANVVSYEKIDAEFTTSSVLTAAATVDVDFDAAQIFTLTPTSSTTLNITNPKIGITKAIILTGACGSYTLSFTVGGTSGTFNLIAGEYDDASSTKNFIQIICVSATEFWYSISQIAT